MYSFNYETYIRLSEIVLESISDSDFFSGKITLNTDQTEIKLTMTLIVYRHKSTCKQDHITDNCDIYSSIYGITPVWWEVVTTTKDGEINNDFDFKILKNIILI